jgi:Mn-dependent DtxR family transcriptional regulator
MLNLIGCYAPEDKPVTVYDTQGLEHGAHEEFLREIREFLNDRNTSADVRDHLHVVWCAVPCHRIH